MAQAMNRQRIVRYSQETPERDPQDPIQQQIRYFSKHPEQINDRLKALDKEWDIERALGADASALFMVGNTLGFICDKKLCLVPSTIGALLLQYAVQDCCPPEALLREMGMRSAEEIQAERRALRRIFRDAH